MIRCFAVTMLGFGVVALLFAGNASAALTGLTNGDYETFDLDDPNGNIYFDSTANHWSEHEHATNGNGIWTNNATPPHTGLSGSGQGSMIFNAPPAAEPEAVMMQSLGTVDASDVGKIFTFGVGVAAWDWLDRAPHGTGQLDHSGTFTASFRTGSAPDPGFTYGTLLGTDHSFKARVVNGNGIQGDVAGETTGLVNLAATYVPTAGDIGEEIFAVIHLNNDVEAHSGQNRYVLDNATLSATTLPGLATTLANGDFETFSTTTNPYFDFTVDKWGEHELYAGPGPNGNGAGIWPDTAIPPIAGVSGDGQLSLIGAGVGPNQSTVMQSLGHVAASDVGKAFEFSAGAAAWDWFDGNTNYSGEITLSFREGASPDDGSFANFDYGALLGTADSAIFSVVNGDGIQDDDLLTLIATYTPELGDIGKEVFVAINLETLVRDNSAENRYVVDNATLRMLSIIPEPSTLLIWTLGLFGLAWYGRRRRK